MRDLAKMIREARVEIPLISEDVRRLNAQVLKEFETCPKRERNKYNTRRTTVEGKRFDSAWEAERYGELRLQERAGVIQNLQTQLPFVLAVHGVHICYYVADFVYERAGKRVVEDAKGYCTPEYKIKRALMLAVHGIKIKESRRQVARKRARKI